MEAPAPPGGEPPALPPLTSDQAAALHGIDADPGRPVLLFGATGSGKTEVYLLAIRHALDRGHAAIVLIPEIALTPQAADRFRSRLAAEVGILHSGMTNAERHDVMVATARGEIQVVLGARSGVFAPFRNLGLVVVDEEQESSYKQGEKPRYHARAVALVRARIDGAAGLLGSATPSLGSYHNGRAANSFQQKRCRGERLVRTNKT